MGWNILRLSWKQTPPTLPMLVLRGLYAFFLLYRYRIADRSLHLRKLISGRPKCPLPVWAGANDYLFGGY